MIVFVFDSFFISFRISSSLSTSILLVASSNIYTLELCKRALARASLCLCPPERFPAFSVRIVSSPFSPLKKSARLQSSSTDQSSFSVAFPFAMRRFSFTVPLKNTLPSPTYVIFLNKSSSLISFTFIPPILTSPSITVFLPMINEAIVDFPLPLSPTIPVNSPILMHIETSCKTSLSESYEKFTLSREISLNCCGKSFILVSGSFSAKKRNILSLAAIPFIAT